MLGAVWQEGGLGALLVSSAMIDLFLFWSCDGDYPEDPGIVPPCIHKSTAFSDFLLPDLLGDFAKRSI